MMRATHVTDSARSSSGSLSPDKAKPLFLIKVEARQLLVKRLGLYREGQVEIMLGCQHNQLIVPSVISSVTPVCHSCHLAVASDLTAYCYSLGMR